VALGVLVMTTPSTLTPPMGFTRSRTMNFLPALAAASRATPSVAE
jgi:hypothetical protein